MPAPTPVTINVDGRDLQVPAGMNLIDALEQHGIEIPHYCYHPKLTVAGNCRMCLVETGMPMRDRATNQFVIEPDGRMKIGWGPKPALAPPIALLVSMCARALRSSRIVNRG